MIISKEIITYRRKSTPTQNTEQVTSHKRQELRRESHWPMKSGKATSLEGGKKFTYPSYFRTFKQSMLSSM